MELREFSRLPGECGQLMLHALPGKAADESGHLEVDERVQIAKALGARS
jgi:hypothetical protein